MLKVKNNRKILLIENKEIMVQYLSEVLMKAGFTVYSTGNSTDIQDVYSQNNPDIVITDIVMPEGEGIETIKKLKELNHQLPVLAISGNEEYIDAAKLLGAKSVLLKPILPDTLISTIYSFVA